MNKPILIASTISSLIFEFVEVQHFDSFCDGNEHDTANAQMMDSFYAPLFPFFQFFENEHIELNLNRTTFAHQLLNC